MMHPIKCRMPEQKAKKEQKEVAKCAIFNNVYWFMYSCT